MWTLDARRPPAGWPPNKLDTCPIVVTQRLLFISRFLRDLSADCWANLSSIRAANFSLAPNRLLWFSLPNGRSAMLLGPLVIAPCWCKYRIRFSCVLLESFYTGCILDRLAPKLTAYVIPLKRFPRQISLSYPKSNLS